MLWCRTKLVEQNQTSGHKQGGLFFGDYIVSTICVYESYMYFEYSNVFFQDVHFMLWLLLNNRFLLHA